MDFIHHLIHFVMYSLVLWQVVLGVYVILIWAKRNIEFKQSSPVINVSGTKEFNHSTETSKEKKDLGPIEVDVKREFKVDTTPDEQSVKVDEKIKGKVKTQKDKLKKLRG